MYLLNLYGQAGILLLDGFTNRVILLLILLILVPHDIIPILDGLLDLLLTGLGKVELHYRIVFEL
jgi:hypothetical protein